MQIFLFVLFALASGCSLSVMAGMNGRMHHYVGSSYWATFISFLVGAIVLFFFTLPVQQNWPSVATMRTIPWWLWTAGVIGAGYVLCTVVVAPRLGASVFFSLLIVGQMTTALLLDHFGLLGFAMQRITPVRVIGVVLVIGGALILRIF